MLRAVVFGVDAGIPEVARRARLGHKMPGIAKIYEHVTPEMERQISDALEPAGSDHSRS